MTNNQYTGCVRNVNMCKLRSFLRGEKFRLSPDSGTKNKKLKRGSAITVHRSPQLPVASTRRMGRVFWSESPIRSLPATRVSEDDVCEGASCHDRRRTVGVRRLGAEATGWAHRSALRQRRRGLEPRGFRDNADRRPSYQDTRPGCVGVGRMSDTPEQNTRVST